MRAQISIEMILILAAVLAIAFILVTQLQKVATKAGEKVEERSMAILNVSNTSSLLPAGAVCSSDSECQSGSCTLNICD
ncbi:MAG: class III signal peptide-containing protein [Candidatus Micrarchaeia archaeon]